MAAAFSLEALTKARESGFADGEIQSLLAEQDPKLGKAFESGFTLEEVADAFTQAKGVAPDRSFTSALKQGIDAPLEAIGTTAEVFGAPGVGKFLKGLTEAPVNYDPAGPRVAAPQPGDVTVGGFGVGSIPRAITEQLGQVAGSIISRAVGYAAGSAIGGTAGAITGAPSGPGALVTGRTGMAAGGRIGAMVGPFAFEAFQIAGPTAIERARNNGRTEPNKEDLVYALTTAAGSGALNAIGAKYLPGGEKAVGAWATRIAKGIAGEGATELGQSLVEQTGGTAGTEAGLSISPKQAVAEALIGGGAGGTIAAITPQITKAEVQEQSKAIDTTIEEVATAEPPPVVVDVTQGGVRTGETFVPGQAEPETIISTPSAETPTGSVPVPPVTAETTAPGAQADIAAAAQAAGARYDTFDEQTGMHQITLMDEGGESTIYLKPEQATQEGIRDAIEYKRFEMAADSIDTPEKLDEFFRQQELQKKIVQKSTPEEALQKGFTIKAFRGVSKSKPYNDSDTVWLTTNRAVAESYAEEVFGYEDADVVEVRVNPKDIPEWNLRTASEEDLGKLDPDQYGNPQKVGIYHNSDDSMLGARHTAIHVPKSSVLEMASGIAPTAETTGAPETPPTQPQPATATAESEMVPGDLPRTEGAAQLSVAQLEDRIDKLISRHKTLAEAGDTEGANKVWEEAKGVMDNLRKAEGQSMGPGAASAAETLVKYAERKFGIRFQDDPRIATELKEAAGNRFYEVLPNKVTAAEATELIDNLGEDQAERMIRDEKAETPFAVRATVGQILVQRFNQEYAKLKESNREAANAVLNKAADASEWLLDYGTRLGQGVQAFAMWSRLSADGKLASIKKGIRKARENHRNRHSEELDEVLGALNTDRSVQEKEKDIRRLGRRNRIARQVRKKVKDLAKQKQTAESFYEQTSRELGLPEMNAETEARIRALAAEVDAAEDGIPKFIKSGEFLRELKKIEGFNAADFLLTYYYGNILSGGGTQIVNAVDTFFNVLNDVSTMVWANPKAGMTILSGLARGLNEGKADAVLALTRGRKLSDGLMPGSMGVAEVADFGKEGGVPQPGYGKLAEAAKKVLESRPAAIFNLYKYIFRAMGAADAVNFRGAQEARAGLLAHRIATDEGLTSAQRTKRVNEILGWDRYDEFLAKAQEEGFTGQEQVARATELMMMQRPEGLQQDTSESAGESTYNQRPKGFLGAVANGINSVAGKYPATRLVVPFTQIVANVFNRRLDNLPPVALYRIATGYYGSAEANKAAKVRMAMSMAMMGSLFALQQAGVLQITGQGPDDPEKLKQLKQSGWRPYSIKIGNRYYSYASLPISLGLGLIGNTMDWGRYRKPDEDRSFTDATAYAVFGMGSYLFSQSFLSGMADFFDSLRGRSGEASARKFLSSLASAAVPFSGALKDLDALYDDTKRENKTVKAALLANIPFGRFAGRPELNAFGEPIRTGRVRPLMRFTSKEGEDPAWRFVVDHGLKVPVGDPFFKTDPENYEYKKLSGQRMKQWILDNREILASLPKENAQKMLSDAGEAQRNEIKVELLMSGKYQKAK